VKRFIGGIVLGVGVSTFFVGCFFPSFRELLPIWAHPSSFLIPFLPSNFLIAFLVASAGFGSGFLIIFGAQGIKKAREVK